VAELAHQLRATNPVLIVVYPDFLATAISAARLAGISADRIILFNGLPNIVPGSAHTTLNDLVAFGLTEKSNFVERRLYPGEAKTKLAFLSFSSGTTGQPKVGKWFIYMTVYLSPLFN
jgi:4-coumarate--CoA ligase